ncbi:hypothetical protein ACIQU6_41385 [Streptomyces sp. NPDC090442]|uniref:hypothetical protein n=1 Tax=Streptomyces sp. NPDC090442 TaxID=3365962 RepID=UPI0037F97D30
MAHREINPDDCANCRTVFGALVDRQKVDPDTPLTTEEIGRIVGLKKRAAQVHLAHLFACGRIDADRRTPLYGMSQPVLFGAQEWAASVLAPDPTCAKCLVALAGIGWEGQVSMEELAGIVGVGLRTIERHRPHLVRADLLAFRAVPVRKNGKNLGRRPDRFRLMSGLTAPRLEGAALAAVPALADAIVERVRWFTNVTEVERALAARSVAWCLRNGWPEDALLSALDATENRQAYNPSGYLAKLLRKLPTEYVIPAQQVAAPAPRQTVCRICRTAVKTSLSGHVLCGGAVCLEVGTADQPSAPIFRIA